MTRDVARARLLAFWLGRSHDSKNHSSRLVGLNAGYSGALMVQFGGRYTKAILLHLEGVLVWFLSSFIVAGQLFVTIYDKRFA